MVFIKKRKISKSVTQYTRRGRRRGLLSDPFRIKPDKHSVEILSPPVPSTSRTQTALPLKEELNYPHDIEIDHSDETEGNEIIFRQWLTTLFFPMYSVYTLLSQCNAVALNFIKDINLDIEHKI